MNETGRVKVLSEKTFSELEVDFKSLNPNSHTKIYVQCEKCNEIFLRERCKLHQLHNCPNHFIEDQKTWHKWCNHCESFQEHSLFNKNSLKYDGLSSWCVMCQAHRSSDLKKWIEGFFKTLTEFCSFNSIECSVTLADLLEQWGKQAGKCYFSKIDITTPYNKKGSMNMGDGSFSEYDDRYTTAQLHRLDPELGYLPNNVVWTLETIFKEDPHGDFDHAANVRIECKLDHPNSKLPFRKRVTDAGHDIYAAEGTTINPGEVTNIVTGIRVSPPPGWYITVDGRSSLFKEGIVPFRGTIDATYTGPLFISLYNSSKKPFVVNPGDRIAQITLHKIHNVDFAKVSKFSPEYSFRGDAGWGSSGRN